jgi:CRP-like cAMP-binding protein
MSTIARKLAELPAFVGLSEETLRGSLRFWSLVTLPPDAPLFTRGEPSTGLAIVLSGRLRAVGDRAELGELGPGELVGEVTAFLDGARSSATVTAIEETTVLSLRGSGLLALRRQRSPLYDALLGQALTTLCARVRAVNDMVLSQGVVADPDLSLPPAEPAAAEPPPLVELLRRLPGQAELPDRLLHELTTAFTAQAMRAGQRLVAEGDAADCAFVVAEGQVRATRALPGGGHITLARLGPGDPFGVNALVDRSPRSATCLAESDGWLYRVSAAAPARLSADGSLAWRETLLATLATQLRLANHLLDAPGADADFRAEARASGALLGLPLSGGVANPVVPAALRDPLRPSREGVTVIE